MGVNSRESTEILKEKQLEEYLTRSQIKEAFKQWKNGWNKNPEEFIDILKDIVSTEDYAENYTNYLFTGVPC